MRPFIDKLASFSIWLLIPCVMLLSVLAAVLILFPGTASLLLRWALAAICLLLALWALVILARFVAKSL